MRQAQALDILKTGKNVFLTGSAGSGKTYLLNSYINYLKQRGIGVGVTASTGVAATHLGGMTIHSWSGIGVKDELSRHDIEGLLKKRYLRKHFLENSVLVIDEISMLHSHQLDMVNNLAQSFRQSREPFGGMQVIFAGDFFQLPPVARGQAETKMASESEVWQNMDLSVCYLDEQYRQLGGDLLNILNEIRSGNISQNSRELLLNRLNQPIKFRIEPTRLYTHNVDVDGFNFLELKKVNSPAKSYQMRASGRGVLAEILKNGCLAPEELILKVGAKVMFIKNNFELGVVNGTIGQVVGFDEAGFPKVETKNGEIIAALPASWTIEEDGRVLAEIRQVPLRLAWAITVHKSQGLSLDLAEVDLSKSFVPGMGYVALSRVRNLEGLKLNGLNELALKVDEKVLAADESLQQASSWALADFVALNPAEIKKTQQAFIAIHGGVNKFKIKKEKTSGKHKTLAMVNQKMSIKEIAAAQNLKPSTVLAHLEKLSVAGEQMDLDHLMPAKKDLEIIKNAFDKHGWERLQPVFAYLDEKYDYDLLRLVRARKMSKDKKEERGIFFNNLPNEYSNKRF